MKAFRELYIIHERAFLKYGQQKQVLFFKNLFPIIKAQNNLLIQLTHSRKFLNRFPLFQLI